MDWDWSDLVECIIWHHMFIVFAVPISLSRSDTIRQDEFVTPTCTILPVVFKANECMKSTVFLQHLFEHWRTWELKHLSITAGACRLWKPVISFAVNFLHELGNSSVEETVEHLKLYPLPVFEAKLSDKDKAMWPSNLTAKLLRSRGLEICQNVFLDFLLCSSIKTVRLGRYVHFYS